MNLYTVANALFWVVVIFWIILCILSAAIILMTGFQMLMKMVGS